MADDKRPMSIWMPEKLIQRVEEVASDQDRSKSNFARRALRREIERHEAREIEDGSNAKSLDRKA